MKKELVSELKKFGWFALVFYLFFQLWYFKDSPVNVIKIVFAQLYLFIFPGFMLMLFYKNRIDLVHRLLIGSALGYAASLILTIFIAVILKINIVYYYWISPLIIIILGVYGFSKALK